MCNSPIFMSLILRVLSADLAAGGDMLSRATEETYATHGSSKAFFRGWLGKDIVGRVVVEPCFAVSYPLCSS